MIGLGLPIGFQYELEYGVFATVALLMGRLGVVAASAHQIAINIASLTFMVPLGVSSAASVLVGRAVGAGDAGAARARVSPRWRGRRVHGGERAGARVLVPRLLARAYTPDAAVIALAATLIPIAGVFQVFDGLQVVAIGVLRGVGDTRTPLIVTSSASGSSRCQSASGSRSAPGWGPQGLWWGLVAGLTRWRCSCSRVRKRLWRELRRLVIDDVPATAEVME